MWHHSLSITQSATDCPTRIRYTDAIYLATAQSAAYAKRRKDWVFVELKSGHDAMVISPKPLTEWLLSLA